MILGERILLALSRVPGSEDYLAARDEHNTDEAPLALLKRVYPHYMNIITGRSVVDFGCGQGSQTIAIARKGASRVVGVDSNPRTLAKARHRLSETDLQDKVSFVDKLPAEVKGQFDIVISQNSMEHFPDPVAVLGEMLSALKENGSLLITFGPPWYAPYGSHMHFFTKVPWLNIWFSEKTIMTVRSHFRDDGARKYEDVESGLNRMTVRKFENIVRDAGLRVVYKKYECVKRFDFLGKIPFVRELFINHITSVLKNTSLLYPPQ